MKRYDCYGTMMTAREISDKYGLEYKALQWRLAHGWDMDKALGTPIKQYTKECIEFPCGCKQWRDCLTCRYTRCIAENYPAMAGEGWSYGV